MYKWGATTLDHQAALAGRLLSQRPIDNTQVCCRGLQGLQGGGPKAETNSQAKWDPRSTERLKSSCFLSNLPVPLGREQDILKNKTTLELLGRFKMSTACC